ncbi:MAG: S1-like domain-containing RNA-binding protein [Marinilabiliales bacterium]|nr:S1-like domain-containing RNA-binding protein [Marinilabiliales bacterium]
MLQLGRFNNLQVIKQVDFGMYLDGGEQGEILLPKRYVPENCMPGSEIEVFIYLDSEDRIIATTEVPLAQVGEFAWLQVKAINKMGVFLDWGLMKDLMVPYREQKGTMSVGRSYLVYLFLDPDSGRIVASARIEKFLDNVVPEYQVGEAVSLIVESDSLLGYNAIINHLHRGILYHDELPGPLQVGQKLKGFIKKIREDFKIDLSLYRPGYEQVGDFSSQLLAALESAGGYLPFTDRSDPALLFDHFGVSKKVFKKAVGSLYKQQLIVLEEKGIRRR